MKHLKFNGHKSQSANFSSRERESDSFKIETVIELSLDRAEGSVQNLNVNDNDPIIVEFQDGTEWVTSGHDFKEIYGDNANNFSDYQEAWPTHISDDNDRSVEGISLSRVINYKLQDKVPKKLGQHFDNKRMANPGLFRLNDNFELEEFKDKTKGKYLLFIHGTASCTKGSFGGLGGDKNEMSTFKKLKSIYGNNIIAFEHKTVTASPLKNVLDLLEALPKVCEIDVISHSRGGIIADLLARCDYRNSEIGIDIKESIHFTEKKAVETLFKKINHHATQKGTRLKINKVVRVACPAHGTTLLSERLDHFVNVLLKGVGMLLEVQMPWYRLLREFAQYIIHTKSRIDIFPGLEAMVPESEFQNFFNSSDQILKSELIIIEGATKIGGGIFNTLTKILANLYYWEANDLIVNTGSMRGGMQRASDYQFIRFNSTNTSHFHYFTNEASQLAILDAIETPVSEAIHNFHPPEFKIEDRGISLDFKELKNTNGQQVSGEKPIVILLPGIMGSNLYAADKKVWLDLKQICNGGISEYLKIDSPNKVTADSLVGIYYTRIFNYLSEDYDVDILPFDWRKSVTIECEKLHERISLLKQYGKPIKILAHSMGGLIVRQLMIKHRRFWDTYINSEGSAFVMLGTPWMGSHLIMQVLTGHSRRVKQIAVIDRKNKKRDLLEIFNKYPGIYELLPLDTEEKLEKIDFWKKVRDSINHKFTIPKPNILKKFETYKSQVTTQEYNFKNTYYIAGKASSTVNGYHIKTSLFGNSIAYTRIREGDGSVTWKSGIPDKLSPDNVYYTDVDHTNLANVPHMFHGIKELFEDGVTSIFDNNPSVDRGGSYKISGEYVSNYPEEAMGILSGSEFRYDMEWTDYDRLNVEVVNGDLKMASYPIMVGHFESEGLMNGEKALNKRFNNILSHRHEFGQYPSKLRENCILFRKDGDPKGAIIVGLGNSGKLTAYNLVETIKAAVIDYVLQIRDNDVIISDQKFRNSISSLCIGSGFGKLSMENSIAAILLGISKANKVLERIDEHVPRIKNVQFIEFMDHIATNAYSALHQIESKYARVKIKLTKKIKRKHGRRKGLYYKDDDGWWHNLTTTKVPAEKSNDNRPALKFLSSSGIARVEEESNYASDNITEDLIEEVSNNSVWNEGPANTLFNLLIPNSFKEILRTQNNILWKMDLATASYPWEMFHDSNYDSTPIFVNAGLIRQLITSTYREKPDLVRKNEALVIGVPKCDPKLPFLKKAEEEAYKVVNKLKGAGFNVISSIKKTGNKVFEDVMNNDYKVMHIAGHGVFSPNEGKVGIVLDKGRFLSPEDIDQKSIVPEFVFINCCYSGTLSEGMEVYFDNRHKLAANIGTQLIRMGAEAVVVAGWKINDAAAHIFAENLYELLLEGYPFGEAVLLARQACYRYDNNRSTWAAYQCYGDPWYRLAKKSPNRKRIKTYITEDEVLIDLYNLLYSTEIEEEYNQEKCIQTLQEYIKRAKDAEFVTPKAIELVAKIYHACGLIEEAFEKYTNLLQEEDADYSVKSLEQYCNVLAKLMVKRYNSDPESVTKSHKEDLLSKLNLLSSIGESSERLSLMGSAYKRLAQIESDKNITEDYLTKMSNNYKKAYDKAKGKKLSFRKTIYPLSNWCTGEALTNGIAGKSCINLLNESEKRLDKEPAEGKDFYEDIAVVNIALCQLLFTSPRKHNRLNELKKKVVEVYKMYWNIAGNRKHLHAEIEHLDFLLATVKSRKIKTILSGIKSDIESHL